LHNLALLAQDDSNYAEADSLFERALKIRDKILPRGHLEVAQTLEDYAVLLHKMGRPREAGPLEARAAAIRADGRAAGGASDSVASPTSTAGPH